MMTAHNEQPELGAQPISKDTDYASVLDSRNEALASLSTIACSGE